MPRTSGEPMTATAASTSRTRRTRKPFRRKAYRSIPTPCYRSDITMIARLGLGRVNGPSLATGQRSLGDSSITYPLWPPLTRGCPTTSTASLAYPVEVDYDYARVSATLFEQESGPDLARWSPLLPPLHAPTLGEGGTPLIPLEGVYVKDESRNPTWSHKDRLNRVAVSAAVGAGAPGVVVASSGNHGASAAAYAARAGLPAIVLASADAPAAVHSLVRAYGAKVLAVPAEARWPL